jgi:D-sedoheptulose 7-phosphate isomerase
MEFLSAFREQTIDSLLRIDENFLSAAVEKLVSLRTRNGRLFIAGSGGGAGHASHAAADFRRLSGIESYALGDNVSELTALINDESWADSYRFILQQSRFNANDLLLFFSVGGGSLEKNISSNLVNAAKYGIENGAEIISVVGEPGGYLGEISNVAILIPSLDRTKLTPITEALQAYVWHLLVSHPDLAIRKAMWESTESDGK